MPADLIHQRRFANDVTQLMPRWLFNSMVEKQLNAKFDHARYGLKPTHRFDEQHSMVNDDLPNALASGMIRIKPNVRRLTATGVEFEDGSVVDNIDVILYGTGYEFGFPFVDHKALTVVKNDVSLYKLVFPPDIRPSTLAVIGCVQPAGPTFPIAEMQCRWATRVFKVSSQL
jgi:dimethylaniline monooxygenase (N-oxide forming)